MNMEIGLTHFLVVAAALFCLGLLCLLTRRSAIGLLMGIELMVNAANLNLVAFSHHMGNAIDGQIFALFGIVLAAIEAAVALAIVFKLFHAFNRRIEVDAATLLKG